MESRTFQLMQLMMDDILRENVDSLFASLLHDAEAVRDHTRSQAQQSGAPSQERYTAEGLQRATDRILRGHGFLRRHTSTQQTGAPPQATNTNAPLSQEGSRPDPRVALLKARVSELEAENKELRERAEYDAQELARAGGLIEEARAQRDALFERVTDVPQGVTQLVEHYCSQPGCHGLHSGPRPGGRTVYVTRQRVDRDAQGDPAPPERATQTRVPVERATGPGSTSTSLPTRVPVERATGSGSTSTILPVERVFINMVSPTLRQYETRLTRVPNHKEYRGVVFTDDPLRDMEYVD